MRATERPILMSAPMVRAILAGTKTQTRRVVKPQPVQQSGWVGGAYWEQKAATLARPAERWSVRDMLPLCPYGVPGDRLWVREATLKVEHAGWVGPIFVESDAGRHALAWGYGDGDDPDRIEPYDLRVRPSIHMPRRYARLLLDVTGVRVERLQDISEADAIAEGVWTSCAEMKAAEKRGVQLNHIGAYASLWEQINGPGSWEANPWVWVVSFRRV